MYGGEMAKNTMFSSPAGRVWHVPSTSISPRFVPISSRVSRRAASMGPSPASMCPPGKDTFNHKGVAADGHHEKLHMGHHSIETMISQSAAQKKAKQHALKKCAAHANNNPAAGLDRETGLCSEHLTFHRNDRHWHSSHFIFFLYFDKT